MQGKLVIMSRVCLCLKQGHENQPATRWDARGTPWHAVGTPEHAVERPWDALGTLLERFLNL